MLRGDKEKGSAGSDKEAVYNSCRVRNGNEQKRKEWIEKGDKML